MRWRTSVIGVWVLVGRALWSVARAAEPESLDHWKAAVRAKFPEVPQLSSAHLAVWLADTSRPNPVLLDVRTKKEFRVSHLPGARRVDPDASAAEVLRVAGASNQALVVYCSVGWRSSALAERLRSAGLTNVSNLEGSIFGWANEGRPLMAGDRPAATVHPYNQTFGRLLLPERRAEP
jgi:rhodanese-related sulfurtransferase